jgi:hypothetical protein
VVVSTVAFDDQLVHQIVGIYNETPVRQGRPFWHYGKSADTVRKETETYLDQSEFLGAWVGDELVGFLKIVYVGHVARLMFILSKLSHRERPTNALIAKAVQRSEERRCSHLTYGSFAYDGDAETSLTVSSVGTASLRSAFRDTCR